MPAKASESFFTRNKAWIIPVGILVVLALLLLAWVGGTYNSLVSSREGTNTKWADVQSQYQRRADLVPNLVQTVAGIAQQERTVFTDVTEARSRVGQVQLSESDLSDPAKVKAFQDAQSQLGGALSRLIAVAENYPQLKSSENFLALQSQLEGTENRIAVARQDYNAAVRDYNTRVQRFPTVIIANMFGFRMREYFQATDSAQAAPTVTKDQFQ
jgi:LemA protein